MCPVSIGCIIQMTKEKADTKTKMNSFVWCLIFFAKCNDDDNENNHDDAIDHIENIHGGNLTKN